jgi:phosphopantothenoylcysteine decarboxylase/phosphopantothenate--cysteine ligase
MSRAAGAISIELEPTEDIAAAACAKRSPGQVVVGFSLEREGDVERAVKKMKTKGLDMIVFNPLATMGAEDVVPMLLYPDGRAERLERAGKADFAKVLVERSVAIVGERAESRGQR